MSSQDWATLSGFLVILTVFTSVYRQSGNIVIAFASAFVAGFGLCFVAAVVTDS